MNLQRDEHIPHENAETKRLIVVNACMYSVVSGVSYGHMLHNQQSQRYSLCTVMSQAVQVCISNKVEYLEKEKS